LPLPQFEGVQIEMLPEIDAIILRGRDQQLTDLAEIIKRLDEASRLTRPEIEIVPLQHAGSEDIAKVIVSIQEKLTGTIQGRVSVTPLGKPNSLLLIGWGEAILSTKDLIAKLDQPASPDTQFEVIQLQHAPATELQTQLQTFFKNRVGLAPTIQSMVDSRTNAIVVHAPTRDLVEIRKLIAQLDVPRGTLVQQSRVFLLRHSLAADIAKSLQQALATSATGTRASIQLLDQDGRPMIHAVEDDDDD
jgi:type II secretory pathway component GspD/PulD (secretin)